MGSFDSLPNPIIQQILSLLVPSRIISFSRVNKRWLSIVDNPVFWSDYGFNQPRSRREVLMYLSRALWSIKKTNRRPICMPTFKDNKFLRELMPQDVMFLSFALRTHETKICGTIYQYMDKQLLEDRSNIANLLKGSGHFIRELPEQYRQDRYIATVIATHSVEGFNYIAPFFGDDLAIISRCVRRDPSYFKYASHRLMGNPQLFVAGLPYSSSHFEDLDNRFKLSIPFVREIVSKAGTVWTRLPERLQYCETIIRIAHKSLIKEIDNGGYSYQSTQDRPDLYMTESVIDYCDCEGNDGYNQDGCHRCDMEEMMTLDFYRSQDSYLDGLREIVSQIDYILTKERRFLW